MLIHIQNLESGDRAKLIDFGSTDTEYRRRLLSLGLTRGAEIKVVRVAPLGCPVQVDVRGTSITLRKEEAAALVWERI